MWIAEESYYVVDNKIISGSGSSMPYKFTFELNDNKVVKYEIPKGMDLFYDNAVAAYEAAKVYTDRNGVSVINCTRGGMLEVFKRESLENVLGN